MLDLGESQAVPLILEGVAALIWQQIDGSRSSAQIIRELAPRFDASSDIVATDITAFLEQLSGLGLIEIASP
jgi:hypothetical protein